MPQSAGDLVVTGAEGLQRGADSDFSALPYVYLSVRTNTASRLRWMGVAKLCRITLSWLPVSPRLQLHPALVWCGAAKRLAEQQPVRQKVGTAERGQQDLMVFCAR